MNTLSEKRISPRFFCDEPGKFPVDLEDGSSKGFLCDVSRGGFSFYSQNCFPVGDICRFKIRPLDFENSITCESRIVWTQYEEPAKQYLCGAEFLKIDSGPKTDLIDCLYEHWKKKAIGRLS